MEPKLFRYIWQNSKRQQIVLILIVIFSIPGFYLSLELPAWIINGPLIAPHAATYFRISIPGVVEYPGVLLNNFEALITFSLLFLFLVLVNSAFNYAQNAHKRILGERLMRKLRYELIDRTLRFPMKRFRRTSGSEIASMVKDEVEELGEFIGDAYAVPLYQSAQALTALAFILFQNIFLGLIAVVMLLITSSIVPMMRRRLVTLERQRQISSRMLAGRIGERINGILEIKTNGTGLFERVEFVKMLGEIFSIRNKYYHWKFFTKSLNDLLSEVTPFLFYLIGGIFVVIGQIDLGHLVAVLAAYKGLPNPVKQLIYWEQQRLDAQSKYAAVVEQFEEDELMPDVETLEGITPPQMLTGNVEARYAGFVNEEGAFLLHPVSFSFPVASKVALIGSTHSGSEVLLEALAGAAELNLGDLIIDQYMSAEMPENVRGQRTAYLEAKPYFTQKTIRDALLYGLKTAPENMQSLDTAAAILKKKECNDRCEAELLGQPYLEENANWLNYKAAGVADEAELQAAISDCLETVNLKTDILKFGLRAKRIHLSQGEIKAFLKVRKEFRRIVRDRKLQHLVEVYRPDYFHRHSSIQENLIFGSILDMSKFSPVLCENPIVVEAMQATGCHRMLFDFGVEVARVFTGLLGGQNFNHEMMNKLSLMSEVEVAHYASLISDRHQLAWELCAEETRHAMIDLAGRYCEMQHGMGLFEPDMQKMICRTRVEIRRRTPKSFRGKYIRFYNPNRWDKNQGIGVNLVFGRVNSGHYDNIPFVEGILRELLEQAGLLTKVMDAGFEFEIGHGGQNISVPQKQKLNLARALLKRPDLILINQGLDKLEKTEKRTIVSKIIETFPYGVFYTAEEGEVDDLRFDEKLYFEDGHLVERLQFEEL